MQANQNPQFNAQEPILIRGVASQQLETLTHRLSGYAKSCSILWLSALGLPVLNGLIVDSCRPYSFERVRNFSKSQRSHSLLLRIDRKNQRWTSRRGGYLVELETIPRLCAELSREEFIPILLEPASPYLNHCALTALILEDEGQLVIEAVGAGFDASDILRSDLMPHERWKLSLSRQMEAWHAGESPKRTFLVSRKEYEASRKKRLSKIAAKMLNPSFPERAGAGESEEHLLNLAASFLQKTGETTLLSTADYTALSVSTVEEFARLALELKNGLDRSASGIASISVAASVIGDGRMVFWDFFPTDRSKISLLWN